MQEFVREDGKQEQALDFVCNGGGWEKKKKLQNPRGRYNSEQ